MIVWVARNPPGYAFIEFDDRRDADDAISGLDGKHGWRVEMSRNYGSGRTLGRESSDVRCYDCGGTGHFARECRARSSYRRSLSPRYRSSRSVTTVDLLGVADRLGVTIADLLNVTIANLPGLIKRVHMPMDMIKAPVSSIVADIDLQKEGTLPL
ncbi:hypothetical protein ACLOJK_010683 [Asimina triloba]